MKVYFTLVAILVFYSTAFAINPYSDEAYTIMTSRAPASANPYTCQEALTAFVQRMRPFNYDGRYKTWHQFEAPDSFLTKKTALLKSIESWQEVGQRKLSMTQLKKIQVTSSLEESLRIAKADDTVELFTPLFFEVEQSYYLAESRMASRDDLLRFLAILQAGGDSLEAKTFRQNFEKKFVIEFNGWDKLKTLDDKLALVEKFLSKKTDEITVSVSELNWRLDEYEAVRELLMKLANDDNHPHFKDAKYILDKLATKNTLDSYALKIGREDLPTPSIEDLNRMVNRHPVGELISLNRMVRLERWTALLSRMPDGVIFSVLDKIISKIPGFNTPEVRSFIRTVLDNKKRLVFYPNVDKILTAKGSMEDRLTALVAMNTANPGDELLVIFSRRTDAYQTWRDLLSVAKNKAEALKKADDTTDFYVTFYERMLKADANGKKLGELPPWHVPRQAAILRTVVDGILIIGVPYGSYELIRWIWGDDKLLSDLLKEKNEWEREKKILAGQLTDDQEKIIDDELSNLKK